MNNTLICIGRITRDLELRYTTNNKAVVNIPLAINNGKDDTKEEILKKLEELEIWIIKK